MELLALIRDGNVTAAQLRSLLELSPEALQAVADLIKHTLHAGPQRGKPGSAIQRRSGE